MQEDQIFTPREDRLGSGNIRAAGVDDSLEPTEGFMIVTEMRENR
jgi:hypothetical protein